jgi:hypothetical protein
MRRGWCGNQKVGCILTLADSTLFDCEPCAAQRVDHLRHRTEMEAVSREWQRFHHIRVSHSDNDPTRASHHPS